MMQLILYIAVMAAVTYLIRCLPLVCFSRRIKSPLSACLSCIMCLMRCSAR